MLCVLIELTLFRPMMVVFQRLRFMSLTVSALVDLSWFWLMTSTGGYAYCAIGALSILGRLPSKPGSKDAPSSGKAPGLTNVNATIRWLMDRQQNYIAIDEDSGDEDNDQDLRDRLAGVYDHTKEHSNNGIPAAEIPSLSPLTFDECYYVGQNGRCNKPSDTCYSFWNCGSLDVCFAKNPLYNRKLKKTQLLGQGKLINREPIRRFLLEQTQFKIGGFGKTPGVPGGKSIDLFHL